MPKTIVIGFDTFISWLQPSTTEHDRAISHKNSVERNLINNFSCYSFFETGSFGNGTGIRHHSDTDYFAIIPADKLPKDSSVALRKIRESLGYTFPRTTGIVVNCPAVRIPFGIYSSETMEITPGYFVGFVDTPLGKFSKYGIPDCNGGWMYSSPIAHNAYVDSQNNRLDKKVKNLIRLVKAWKYYNDVPISSFYLELRVTKYAEGEGSLAFDFDLERFFKKLFCRELPSIRDPMGISGPISACKSVALEKIALSKLETAVSRSEKAMDAKSRGNIDDAFYWWNLLFNYEFPAR